ncbi:MAG: hypothetical protein Ct9H300mP11_01880 [Chloroflexota bacterium]|nr:MAG: hypothetical protein Ct9H300mP11_01880 [Chloroflexota bacterium]
MDLSLTPEQEMLKTAVRRFVQQEYPKETLLQIASPTESTPDAPWEQLTQTGWLGILIPTEYGGEGGSLQTLEFCLKNWALAPFLALISVQPCWRR